MEYPGKSAGKRANKNIGKLAAIAIAGSVGFSNSPAKADFLGDFVKGLTDNMGISETLGVSSFEGANVKKINSVEFNKMFKEHNFKAFYTGPSELPGIIVLDNIDGYRFNQDVGFNEYVTETNEDWKKLQGITRTIMPLENEQAAVYDNEGNFMGIVIPYNPLIQAYINKTEGTYRVSIGGSNPGGGASGAGAGAGAGAPGSSGPSGAAGSSGGDGAGGR